MWENRYLLRERTCLLNASAILLPVCWTRRERQRERETEKEAIMSGAKPNGGWNCHEEEKEVTFWSFQTLLLGPFQVSRATSSETLGISCSWRRINHVFTQLYWASNYKMSWVRRSWFWSMSGILKRKYILKADLSACQLVANVRRNKTMLGRTIILL